MITDKQNNAGPIEWADYVIQAAARIANAGSMFGYEKIVAARIWLAGHNARLLETLQTTGGTIRLGGAERREINFLALSTNGRMRVVAS